jgi:hypothetical protein
MCHEKPIALSILRYLDANPEARDTAEGIAQWWLRKEWIERKIEDVQHAIQSLTNRGFILEEPNTGAGNTLYRVNPYQRDAIKTLLRNTEEGDGTH